METNSTPGSLRSSPAAPSLSSGSSRLLKLLKLNIYVPARFWSERIYYPLIQKGIVKIINVEELGLCLTLTNNQTPDSFNKSTICRLESNLSTVFSYPPSAVVY